jgi:hypothetical protein
MGAHMHAEGRQLVPYLDECAIPGHVLGNAAARFEPLAGEILERARTKERVQFGTWRAYPASEVLQIAKGS